MKFIKKRILFIVVSVLFVLSLVGCKRSNDKDISIIYTTDVHCGFETNLGYSKVSAYKDKLAKTNYVSLVDAGDFLQGEFVGVISKGKHVIDIMNKVGYDVVTLGNHEFDYGVDELSKRLSEFNGEVTSCNLSYTGNKENKLKTVKPYVIKEYGNVKVGFVGVTTPLSRATNPAETFSEDGNVVYDFTSNKNAFYNIIQQSVDNCKKAGADHIILITHLGSLDIYSPYSSVDVISNTYGYDAVLDGHAHIDLEWTTKKNKKNEDVLLADTGYKLNEFASITISKDGKLSHEYIKEYDETSEKIDNFIKEINSQIDELGNKVVATIDTDFKITSETGARITRNQEITLGNLIADSYRTFGASDIGIINGGGIRAALSKGDITYKQIKDVHPYGNLLAKKKTKGQTILDYLEFATRNTQKKTEEDGKAVGEFGGFPQVSGIKFTIDTSIKSSVVVEETGDFVKIEGERRIKDVYVLENGTYVALDPNKYYTVSSNNFILEKGGDGANMFMNDESLSTSAKFDYEIVVDYIVDICKGVLKDKYSQTEGRINII